MGQRRRRTRARSQRNGIPAGGPLFKSEHGELSNLRWDLAPRDMPGYYSLKYPRDEPRYGVGLPLGLRTSPGRAGGRVGAREGPGCWAEAKRRAAIAVAPLHEAMACATRGRRACGALVHRSAGAKAQDYPQASEWQVLAGFTQGLAGGNVTSKRSAFVVESLDLPQVRRRVGAGPPAPQQPAPAHTRHSSHAQPPGERAHARCARCWPRPRPPSKHVSGAVVPALRGEAERCAAPRRVAPACR